MGPIYNSRAHCEDVPGSFWVESLAIPLHWMKAFLEGSAGTSFEDLGFATTFDNDPKHC